MRVLCVGEMLADIFVRTVNHVAFGNDTVQVEEICLTGGGDSHNNAVNFAKLGNQVTYLGRVGCDSVGAFVESQAVSAGIDMSHVVHSATAQQTKSVILLNSAGDRTFLQYPGTSEEFSVEDCDFSLLDQADLLQIGGAFHLPKFDGEGAAQLLKAAKQKGVVTSMDVTTDRTGRWKGILEPCFPYLDYFLPSVEQAAMIAGTDLPRDMAAYFLDCGVSNVTVKLGDKGSYFRNREQAFYAGIYDGLQVVDTTGAGDAFCAGFLTGVGEGASPVECVTLGTACSSLAIQKVGATAGMKNRISVQRFIDGRPELNIYWEK